jgi:hypothetical protein
VKKPSEYRRYAEECRALANKVPLGEQHDAIAALWEKLALVCPNRAHGDLLASSGVCVLTSDEMPRAFLIFLGFIAFAALWLAYLLIY